MIYLFESEITFYLFYLFYGGLTEGCIILCLIMAVYFRLLQLAAF